MTELPEMILQGKVQAPDLFCGGTPCQAFSLAGWKNGLEDKRGQLTITFIEIANAIDEIRKKGKKDRSIVLWENVEGVLNDKTNAFGNFIAGLAGFDDEIKVNKWTKSGYLEGKSRNVAWRVIDAKYFGLPQQRKRLYVLAGGKDFRPDQVLFEFDTRNIVKKIKANKQEKSNENVFNLFSESNPKKKNLLKMYFTKTTISLNFSENIQTVFMPHMVQNGMAMQLLITALYTLHRKTELEGLHL